MKLQVATIGRPRATWAKSALEHYRKFLQKYGGADFHFVSGVRVRNRPNINHIRATETGRLLGAVSDRATRIFVDRTGRMFSSDEWARNLERVMQKSSGPVVFLIGGPLGLDLNQKRRSDEVWSLAPLTFPHELALIVLCEQLARALSILRGDSYHN